MSIGTVITGIGSNNLLKLINNNQIPNFSIGHQTPKTKNTASGTIGIIYNTSYRTATQHRIKTAQMLNKPPDDIEHNEELKTTLHHPIEDQYNSWFTTYTPTHNHPDKIFEQLTNELTKIGYDIEYYGENDEMYIILSSMSEEDK